MEIKPRRYFVGNNGHELVGISQKTKQKIHKYK